MKLGYFLLIFSFFTCYSARADKIRLTGELVQGGLVLGWTTPKANIYFNGSPIRQGSLGHFLLGFPFNAKKRGSLEVKFSDGSIEKRGIKVKQRSYDIQRIDGLPVRKVKPRMQDILRIKSERMLMERELKQTVSKPLYTSGFISPVRGRITGVYGSQRILNGIPKRPHFGLDIAAPSGTEVLATADGLVAFVHPGMFFNGKTVIIDHGLGLRSIYIHMSAISVKKGQKVSKGQIIGKVGRTGRTTGPHLHWGVRLNNVELDPTTLLSKSR